MVIHSEDIIIEMFRSSKCQVVSGEATSDFQSISPSILSMRRRCVDLVFMEILLLEYHFISLSDGCTGISRWQALEIDIW
jgi:hypothetical protein